ncbi:glycogen synthase (plasmid) [Runella rosea]|uniref:Glycogen synthase n=1 Tax=Runella rosea TaxID=2259595 RepID=A0A344TTD2_9BACT|nr:glycogen synthase [Runella rosea]AXE21903.1 glycogen synthase [Runella rosea]
MTSLITNSKKKLLFEVSWEICNQIGGIHTVIRSKIPSMMDKWGDGYIMMGPYFAQKAVEFEPIDYPNDSPVGKTVEKLRGMGLTIHCGYWLLVTGKPRVILFDLNCIWSKLSHLKTEFQEQHKVQDFGTDPLVNQVLAFGEMIRLFIVEFMAVNPISNEVVVHFHEWMTGSGLPKLFAKKVNIATVFTTHATILGRYLAQNEPDFYKKLEKFDWRQESRRYGIEAQVIIERMAAQSAGTFTTISEITSQECIHFLGRVPDLITPNGIKLEKFPLFKLENLHLQYRKHIHKFIMGHFFPSYSFDLNKTIYFFTSGRFEYKNKGFDITLEALSLLNTKMKQARMDTTVVMFIITNQKVRSVNASVINSHSVLNELEETCKSIQREVGSKLFKSFVTDDQIQLPNLNSFVSEYLQHRRVRTILSWRSENQPAFLTHDLAQDDEITDYCRQTNLLNNQKDKVKVVYHPEFITSSNPLFGLEYGQFVCGCHLGIFPSFYEPWGYTPQECVVAGVPTVTSNLSGFGHYVTQNMKNHDDRGIYVVNRKSQTYTESVEQLTDIMFRFVKKTRRSNESERNRMENVLEKFSWNNMRTHYDTAHEIALKRKKNIPHPTASAVEASDVY